MLALTSTRRIPFAHAFSVPPKTIVIALLQLAVLLAALAAARPVHAADTPSAQPVRAIKQRIAPHYPEIARRMHVSGSVRVEATVNADGTVAATKAVTGNRMLSDAAEDAVRKWKFVPAAEQSKVEVDVNFALN